MESAMARARFRVRHFPWFRELTGIFYVYLYLPIVVLIVYSFNANLSATVWTEFSLEWYVKAFGNDALRSATINSLMIALVASVLATSIAVPAALATSRGARFRGMKPAIGTIMMPLVLPEVVIGVAIFTFFSAIGLSLGKFNLIIAHVLFCLPFAFMPLRARLQDMSNTLENAAMDLYATTWTTFRRVTLPLLMPGIVSGLMLAFIVSMDNFVISIFVAEPGSTTLPMFIFSMVRRGITPEVNAASTLILTISFFFATASYLVARKK